MNELVFPNSMYRILPALAIVGLLGVVDADQLHAEPASKVGQVTPGTIVGNPEATRWNRIVLLAQPRIASGDVDALPKSIRDTVSSFVLTILATVAKVDPTAVSPTYRLVEVGVGFSSPIDGKLTVLTPDTHRDLGARLTFFQKHMLKTNAQQLATARFVAKTSTLFVFDTPGLLHRDGKHREFIIRHFVWVDARTGKSSALVWMMSEDAQQNLLPPREPLRWIPSGTKEDRKIHVDGNEFFLGGIPKESAFALEDLPPGKPVQWSERAKQLAALSSYSADTLRELTRELNTCLQRLRDQ